MLKAVVFDMDDTLLHLNLSAFIAVFAKEEATILSQIARRNMLSTFAQFSGALFELNANERDDDLTNMQFFRNQIERRCGVPLDDPVVAEAFEFYEREVLPTRNDSIIRARPRTGSHAIIEQVVSHGLRTALLTNPSFSRACIECRMGWGDMLDMPFELVTSMENSTRCKPDARYYLESLEALGLAPEEVLMVGNDPKRDFPSPDCGIQTAYVGAGQAARATWSGTLQELADGFDEVVDLFYAWQEAEAARRSADAQPAG